MHKLPAICCSLLLVCDFSLAANNPAYSTFGSSSGSVDISITRDPNAPGPMQGVRISNLNDFDFGVLSGNPVARSDDICIYARTGLYEITTYSQNHDGSGGHQLRDDSGQTNTYIDYDVAWDDLQGSGFNNLDHGLTSAAFSGAETLDIDCTTGMTARIQITISAVDFLNATYGQLYTDTLTITAGIL